MLCAKIQKNNNNQIKFYHLLLSFSSLVDEIGINSLAFNAGLKNKKEFFLFVKNICSQTMFGHISIEITKHLQN
jgi:hypothetical protein